MGFLILHFLRIDSSNKPLVQSLIFGTWLKWSPQTNSPISPLKSVIKCSHCVYVVLESPFLPFSFWKRFRKKEMWRGKEIVTKILNGGGGLSVEQIKDATVIFPQELSLFQLMVCFSFLICLFIQVFPQAYVLICLQSNFKEEYLVKSINNYCIAHNYRNYFCHNQMSGFILVLDSVQSIS